VTGDPEAQEALQSLVSRYASLRSYRDRGHVTQSRSGADPIYRILFSTFYQGPLFRFQFRKPMSPDGDETLHVIGFDGRSCYQVQKSRAGEITVTALDNLSVAVAQSTGVSRGSSHTIARLLMDGIGGLGYSDLINVRLKETAQLDGLECRVLLADHPLRAAKYELWIECERGVLRRRIAEHGNWTSLESREDIRVDEPIDSRVFAQPDNREEDLVPNLLCRRAGPLRPVGTI
jgi:hypothetical protein